MPRPPGLPKTGGRQKGSKNRPKPVIRSPEEIEQERAVEIVAVADVRTPKAVMLSAMIKFERMSDVLMGKAERMTRAKADPDGIARLVAEAHRFTVASVQCAEKVAPYVHARLLAVESRGDMTEDKAPFVIRAPLVMADSTEWQAMVGSEILDLEAAQAASQPRPAALEAPPAQSAPEVPNAPAASPVVLVADPKTSRIMPVGPVVVKPFGSQEWLDAVAADRRKAAG